MSGLDWLERLGLEGYPSPFRFAPGSVDDPIIARLVRDATKDPQLGEFILQKKLSSIRVFYYNDIPVGFAIPRRESDGRYRTGPIYVNPRYRHKGVAKAFVAEYFSGRPGRCYIEPHNIASIRLFTSCGFRRTSKTLVDGDDTLYEYLKD